MTRKKGGLTLLFFIFLFTSSAFWTTAQASDRGRDRLIIASYQKMSPLNPILTKSSLSARLIEITFNGLIWLDEQLIPQPQLAESWNHSQNGLVWTFHIKKGIHFHDGSPLTAEDVAFTYNAIKDLKGLSRFSFIFQEVDQIIVKEPFILQIILKRPLVSFLQYLYVGILPKHLLDGKDLNSLPTNEELVGTGPYKIKLWSETEAILESNETYFLGKPDIDEIHVKVYPSQEAIWAKLMSGEVDYFAVFLPGGYEVLQQVPHFNFYSVLKPYYYIVTFNLNVPMFADSRVRKALNYAINKEELISKVLKNRGEAAAGTIYPGSWAHNPKVKPYAYNPKKALTLLKEAGWADHNGDHILDKDGKPFEFKVFVNADEIKKKTLMLIEQQLLDIGIQIEITLIDLADLSPLFKKGFQTNFVEKLAVPDPDISYIFWHSSQIQGGFNRASYNNPKINRLLERGREEIDQSIRKAIYFKYQEEMFLDPPGIFLFWTDYLVGVHQRFKGVKMGSIRPFSDIHEWYVSESGITTVTPEK